VGYAGWSKRQITAQAELKSTSDSSYHKHVVVLVQQVVAVEHVVPAVGAGPERRAQ